MKIAITGANGYIASLIQLYNPQHQFVKVSRKTVNYEEPTQVKQYFETLEFDMVLHTAANATTADCENDPETTHKINTQSTIAIADVCKQKQKRLVFFSTEQCFNGKTCEGPFSENDELCSITNYGLQKQEADEYISEHLTNYVTLRLSWMMGLEMHGIKPSPNIIKNTLSAIRNKKETLFTVNEIRGLTYAQHLASQFDKIIDLDSGVYHFSSENTLNTYEAAKYVAKTFGYDEETINTYILPNHERYKERARDYRLLNTKIKSQGIYLASFEEDVQQVAKDFGWK